MSTIMIGAKLKPSRILFDLIRSRDWSQTRLRIFSHPYDTTFQSRSSRSTPLHCACIYKAPRDILELLLHVNQDALFEQDNEGWTPLHLAFLYDINEEVICIMVQRGGKRLASIQGEYIGSPLHVACCYGASPSILRLLLQANPSMATNNNNNNKEEEEETTTLHNRMSPAAVLWTKFRKETNLEELTHIEHPALLALLTRMTLLLDAAAGRDLGQQQQQQKANDNEEEEEFCNIIRDCLLHDVLHHYYELHQLVEILARLHPPWLQRRDDKGNLPLHIVARQRHHHQEQQYHHHRRQQDSDLLDALLRVFPQAANIPDGNGCLPLHLAIRHGGRTWTTGISSLARASPESISTRSLLTHFYPAQEAAKSSSSSSTSDDSSPSSVHTVYELLLAWPPIVKQQEQ